MKAPLAAAISPLAISANPSSPYMSEIYVRTDHHTGNSMPYSFGIVSGLASHKRTIFSLRGCETGPTLLLVLIQED